jgi:CNT family concentrative nucleoside transporter
MDILRALGGISVLMLIALLFSVDRSVIRPRTIAAALACQIAIGAIVLYLPGGVTALAALSRGMNSLLSYGQRGSEFLFGGLVDPRMNDLFGDRAYIFALRVLPNIVFVSALIAVFYYLGLMQKLAMIVGGLFEKLIGVSRVEAFAAVTTIFLGQNELPIAIRPYLKQMSRSELMCAMSSGVASIAGAMLAGYAGLGVRMDYLIAASFMAIPGGLLYAKLLMPTPTGPTEYAPMAAAEDGQRPANVIEAAAIGATNGAKIAFAIATMLIAFIGLIALLNGCVGWLFGLVGLPAITLESLFGRVFSPVAYLIGVPWPSAPLVGQLIGQKLVFNEFVAYISLSPYLRDVGSVVIDEKTKAIASFALCGFANFTSIAVLLGSFGGAIPERRSEVAQLGMRAVLAGTLSNLTSACIAGFFLGFA